MAVTRTSDTELCALAVGETFGAVFSQIDGWRSAVAATIDAADGAISAAALDSVVADLVIPTLATPGALIIGAGCVAAPGFLVDTEWHLAWWLGHSNTFGTGSADPSVRRLEADEDPSSENFRDYTALEWWRVPARTVSPHITGPYVDYLCTDDYTLTLTVPLLHEGTMVGIVGADLYVNEIERLLLPRLRGVRGPATVVNSAGRVVVSTDPHRATGSLLRSDGVSHAEGTPCGETGLSLLVG